MDAIEPVQQKKVYPISVPPNMKQYIDIEDEVDLQLQVQVAKNSKLNFKRRK